MYIMQIYINKKATSSQKEKIRENNGEGHTVLFELQCDWLSGRMVIKEDWNQQRARPNLVVYPKRLVGEKEDLVCAKKSRLTDPVAHWDRARSFSSPESDEKNASSELFASTSPAAVFTRKKKKKQKKCKGETPPKDCDNSREKRELFARFLFVSC